MIDLAPHHLETVESILAEHVPDCEVRAFGSRAKWEGWEYSDLDLAVVRNNKHDWQTIPRLKEAFEESDLPIRVDVLDWHDLAEDFREAVVADCVVVQQAVRPFNWRETTVGEFAPLIYGRSLPASRRNTSGKVPVYGSNGVAGYHDSSLTEGPTVIVGRKGTAGAVHYSPAPCWPIDTTFFVTGRDEELVRFKYYALSALGLDAMNADSAVPGLNRNAAHARELRVPGEPEQRAIVDVLGALDDKIEVNRRMSETLKEMARALFRSWFVDFDPVRAKAEGRPSGLPPDLDALFPSSFEESELGEIPTGWNVRPLRDLVEQVRDSEEPWDLPETVFDHYSIPAFDQDQTPREEYGKEIKSRKFSITSKVVLVSRLNPDIERVWLATSACDKRAICSTEFLVLRTQPPVHYSYVYSLARSRHFQDSLKSLVTGTSRSHQRVSADAVLALNVICPSAAIFGGFDRQTRALLDQSLMCRSASHNIAMQRDVLLPRLLSGKLRVGVRSEATGRNYRIV